MTIAAFDLALSCSGFVDAAGNIGTLVPPKSAAKGMERLRWIRDAVIERAAGVVILEGYGFAPGRGNAARELGELGGVVRLALFDDGVQFVDVSPASLKKYSSGKGNAPKAVVFGAAIRRLGYAGNDHNEADALWLRTMALDYYGLIESPVPASHRVALEGVQWPSIPPALHAA